MLQAHLQGGYGPYGGGQGMPAMPQQHMGYQKGFMQPQQQQQRMEVTVPVPEARVKIDREKAGSNRGLIVEQFRPISIRFKFEESTAVFVDCKLVVRCKNPKNNPSSSCGLIQVLL